MLHYEMTAFRYSAIAITSLVLVCESLGYKNFQVGIFELIEANSFEFDLEEAMQCQKVLVYLMSDQKQEDSFDIPDSKLPT